MPQIMMPMSPLANEIAPAIKNFLETNAKAAADDPSGDVGSGSKALADAIAYGIAKAFGSTVFNTALKLGVGPAAAGSLISTGIMATSLEA